MACIHLEEGKEGGREGGREGWGVSMGCTFRREEEEKEKGRTGKKREGETNSRTEGRNAREESEGGREGGREGKNLLGDEAREHGEARGDVDGVEEEGGQSTRGEITCREGGRVDGWWMEHIFIDL